MTGDDVSAAEQAWRAAEQAYREHLSVAAADPVALHHLEDLREVADELRGRYLELCRRAGRDPAAD